MLGENGYGPLEDELVSLFRTATPDFQIAEELVAQGADLNATSSDDIYENMLAEILMGYWYVELCKDVYECTDGDCDNCAFNKKAPEPIGEAMIKIIQFFLTHGFDVTKNDGKFGAQCLSALTLSTFDQYMPIAARLLLEAGALNVEIDDDQDTVLGQVGSEGSYQDCSGNHHLGNLYEAFYQMIIAHDEGRVYQGIDSYEASYGKRIMRVLAEKPVAGPVFFNLDLPNSKHKNCYRQTLYFEYDGGHLTTTQYADLWTDTAPPDVQVVDVSSTFPSIVGNCISQITYGHNDIRKGTTRYGQPVIIMEMDTGDQVHFTINFGEVDDEDRAAYYSLHNAKSN